MLVILKSLRDSSGEILFGSSEIWNWKNLDMFARARVYINGLF